MNEQNQPLITQKLEEEKNNDGLTIIKEDYQSSPKCGIKFKTVKKVFKNIIFTPVEISAQPYFKYSVTQIKEEQKNDISIAEVENTKLIEDKSKTYNLSTNSNNDDLKSSQQDTKIEKYDKIEQTSDVSDTGNNKEEKENEYNYIHIVEKKESEKTINLSYKFNEPGEKDEKDKKKKRYIHKDSSKISPVLNLNDNEEEKEKEKEKDKVKEKKKRKYRNSQNIYNYLNNIELSYNIHSEKDNNLRFLKIDQTKENKEKDNNKNSELLDFYSTNLKKEKKYSPKNAIKEKREIIMKLSSAFTTTNIKRLKKPKKNQEKKMLTRQHSYIPVPKGKKNKMILNNEREKEKEKDNRKTRRRTLIPKNEIKKENKKLYTEIINKDNDNDNLKLNILKPKHVKMNSLEESNTYQNETLYLGSDNKKAGKEQCWTPKRNNYVFNKDDSIKEMEDNTSNKYACSNSNSIKNRILQKNLKGNRRVSVFVNINNNNNENKKKKRLYTEEKKDVISTNKRKSIFSILKEKKKNKDKNSVKDKDKSSIKDRDKSSVKDKDKSSIKEKDKKLEKKSRRRKNKEKRTKKEKDIINNNPKLQIIRKDKSFTLGSKVNKNLMSDTNQNIKQIQINSKFNDVSNSYDSPNSSEISRSKSRADHIAPNLKDDNNQSDNPDVRRNSTRNIMRKNVPKEKIIELTNKQTIDNINDYTRECLRIIPDLYELGDKMPRCKTKIHPNLSGKKIALFDLDETIVHCIGEINMNNVESFTKQCDAKIKVKLPGGKREITIGINIRPHWEEALKRIQNKYHIFAFTASHESYADSVVNHLDPQKKYFQYRLYRSNCVLCVVNGMKFYVKDLKIVEDIYDLKDVVIIDNSVLSFAYHLDNGIPISPFYDSKTDTELLDIANFLVKYADENDIRDKLKEVYKLSSYMEILKEYNSDENEESSENLDIEEENNEDNKNNKNKTNIDLIKPSLSTNIMLSEEKNEIRSDNSVNKNFSQIKLKFIEISQIFNDEKDKKPLTPRFTEPAKTRKSVNYGGYQERYNKNGNIENKRREKHKTVLFDINFKKEWDEKQKELNNRKL